ncbi:MAG: hypothetical protein ACI9SE_002897 [Neolewinella sp.]|jgi:hypothetical protein
MSKIKNIARIQDVLAGWRTMGSQRLSNGVELLACFPDVDGERWMHTVFPGLSMEALTVMERQIGVVIPAGLRSYYRRCGGMLLFCGLFTMHGQPVTGYSAGNHGQMPADLVTFNREVACLPWARPDMFAFASHACDNSIFVAGMGSTDDEILRCNRRDGAVLQRHPDVFECIDVRLHHLDECSI